jgi:hypothetical protein
VVVITKITVLLIFDTRQAYCIHLQGIFTLKIEANFYQTTHHYIKESGALNKLFLFAKGEKHLQFLSSMHMRIVTTTEALAMVICSKANMLGGDKPTKLQCDTLLGCHYPHPNSTSLVLWV